MDDSPGDDVFIRALMREADSRGYAVLVLHRDEVALWSMCVLGICLGILLAST